MENEKERKEAITQILQKDKLIDRMLDLLVENLLNQIPAKYHPYLALIDLPQVKKIAKQWIKDNKKQILKVVNQL